MLNSFFSFCAGASFLGSVLIRVYSGYILWKHEGYHWTFMVGAHHTKDGGTLFVGAPITWILGVTGFIFLLLAELTGGYSYVH